MQRATEQRVIELLRNHGATKAQRYLEADDPRQPERGIAIHAEFANGWTLSIQAGDWLYSNPRHRAESYSEIEAAAISPAGHITRIPKLVDIGIGSPHDTVCPYVPVERLIELIVTVANLPEGELE